MGDINHSKCRACGAPIFWAKTVNGKSMPIDADPCEDGNLCLLADSTVQVMNLIRQTAWEGPKYKSHFATCPNAVRFRKDPS